MTAVFFNLLTNSIFSLFCGLLVVSFFLWLFRVQTGPWRLFLLSLPFFKIVYDTLRGVPADSVLLSGIDPFMLPPGQQSLEIGAGASQWGPFLNAVFYVRNFSGQEYVSSLGDYLTIWLSREFGSVAPLLILLVAAMVAFTLVFFRIKKGVKFERVRKKDRLNAHALQKISLKFRTIDVYCSKYFSGTPFTGGVLNPYICVPADSLKKLNTDELDAVLKHELGHIRQFDLIMTLFVQVLGDLFWFIPGYKLLSRKIDRLREVVADEWAVKSGASAASLASALIKLKECTSTSGRFILYSAFFREKSLLKVRVNRLIEADGLKPPRMGWQYKGVRYVFALWITTAVLLTTIGGNHTASELKAPDWLTYLLQALGL